MKIEQNKVGMINYSLTDSEGNLIDSSNGQALAYLHGHSNLIPGLEKELEGKTTGDKFNANIPAGEAYGEVEPNLVQEGVPKSMFQGVDNLEVGMRFEAQSEQGVHSVEITDIQDETVTVDGNHPLAGKDLNFDIEVMGVRDATEEELEHGHAHGDGGHQH
ncbi:peptidylprolyl isomerase [Thiomicrospira sp. XS5]|uniref:peptidylprolyl isomerase n=1 Tax=Thiomicrospira sp. XS5 TaxID=1775636 RepID=UPI000748FD5A|nr:peptidylprolyl isomerase [Thiomicrospira sp. XS5]KUJ75383.1 peptidylprolyl isomerase [Thiomicrospira sp. XS5]